jgi:hypothetical protein
MNLLIFFVVVSAEGRKSTTKCIIFGHEHTANHAGYFLYEYQQ